MATKNTKKTNKAAATKAGKDVKQVVLNSVHDSKIRDGLLDFNFAKWITPSVVKLLYVLAIVGILATWLLSVFLSMFGNNFGQFVLVLVGGALAALIGIIAVRVGLETTVALIRIAQNTAKK